MAEQVNNNTGKETKPENNQTSETNNPNQIEAEKINQNSKDKVKDKPKKKRKKKIPSAKTLSKRKEETTKKIVGDSDLSSSSGSSECYQLKLDAVAYQITKMHLAGKSYREIMAGYKKHEGFDFSYSTIEKWFKQKKKDNGIIDTRKRISKLKKEDQERFVESMKRLEESVNQKVVDHNAPVKGSESFHADDDTEKTASSTTVETEVNQTPELPPGLESALTRYKENESRKQQVLQSKDNAEQKALSPAPESDSETTGSSASASSVAPTEANSSALEAHDGVESNTAEGVDRQVENSVVTKEQSTGDNAFELRKSRSKTRRKINLNDDPANTAMEGGL